MIYAMATEKSVGKMDHTIEVNGKKVFSMESVNFACQGSAISKECSKIINSLERI